ncbi:MAG: ROK family protein [Caulobacter sp.]|nr:ROK family protein [Caulobacter sp.]
MIQIGVDLGGTKIEAAALDAGGGYVARQRTGTPDAYEAMIDVICGLVTDIEAQTGRKGSVGVGMPGSVSPSTGVIRNANTVWLNGRSFREDLGQALQRPVRVANDANCLALSEAVDGAAVGARVAFAVILGTGCGGGVVVDGRLVEGANGVGGEWGHLPLPWATAAEYPGPACWCGRQGCLETWVSGSGLRRDFHEQTGLTLTGEEIIAAARVGEPAAAAALDRYLDRLARGLAMVCDIIDPDVFVFGGGLSNVAELYDRLPSLIAPHVFSDRWKARLAPARWGDASGVRGAARLWGQSAWSAHEPA